MTIVEVKTGNLPWWSSSYHVRLKILTYIPTRDFHFLQYLREPPGSIYHNAENYIPSLR